MSSKFETLIRDFLTESSERVCLIYDDAETEIKVTLNDLKLCVENLLNVELTSSVVGIAFDVGSKDVLSVVPSILSVLLKKRPFFVIDPKSQAWPWIRTAILELGIRVVFCDDNFADKLTENTNLKTDRIGAGSGLRQFPRNLFKINVFRVMTNNGDGGPSKIESGNYLKTYKNHDYDRKYVINQKSFL